MNDACVLEIIEETDRKFNIIGKQFDGNVSRVRLCFTSECTNQYATVSLKFITKIVRNSQEETFNQILIIKADTNTNFVKEIFITFAKMYGFIFEGVYMDQAEVLLVA